MKRYKFGRDYTLDKALSDDFIKPVVTDTLPIASPLLQKPLQNLYLI